MIGIEAINQACDSKPEPHTRNPSMLTGFPANCFREIGGVAEAA